MNEEGYTREMLPFILLIIGIELFFLLMGVYYSWGKLGPLTTSTLVLGFLTSIFIVGIMYGKTERPEDSM